MRTLNQILLCCTLFTAVGCQSIKPLPPSPEAQKVLDIERPDVLPESVKATYVLSLERCLELALGGSIELNLGALAPQIRGEDIFIVGERFTPVVFGQASRGSSERESVNTQVGADIFEQDTDILSAGIRKNWLPGTRTELRWEQTREENNSEFSTLNPSYRGELILEVVQPLLNGFGLDVNRASLDRALIQQKIAQAEFEILLESELLSVQRLYWQLVLAGAERDLENESLRLTQEQLAITQDLVDVGRGASLDLTSAQAAEARQAEALILAEARLQRASDQLLQKILPSAWPEALELRLEASSSPSLTPEDITIPSLESAFTNAIKERAELDIADLLITDAEIEILLAKNRRLPTLNLYGQYGYGGLGPDSGEARDDLFDQGFPSWELGLELRFLFFGDSRIARFRKSLLSIETEQLRKERAVTLILFDVRTALQDLESASQQYVAAERSVALARERYEGEMDRFEVGRATLFETESARRDLTDAERSFLRAGVQVENSEALVLAAQGIYADRILQSAKASSLE